jgi:hypothetical protein
MEHVSDMVCGLGIIFDSWYLSTPIHLPSKYIRTKFSFFSQSTLPFSPPKRQEMQIQKLEGSRTVLTSVKNLLNAFQLHNDFLLQITGCCLPTLSPHLHFPLSHWEQPIF